MTDTDNLPSIDVSTRSGHVTIPVARLDRIYLQTTDPTQNSVPMDAHGIEERCEMLYAERPRPLPGDRPLATGGPVTDQPVLTAERGCEVTDLPPGNRVFVGPGGQLDLDKAFTYLPPKPDQIIRYGALRGSGRTLAEKIAEFCPPSPERSTAIAKVREAIMWANASISCGEPGQEPETLPQRERGKVTVHADRGYRFDTAADVRGVITLNTRCLDCNDSASYDETQDMGWKWRESHARSTGHTGFQTRVTDSQR